jgi:hypothetical protein
MALFPLGILSAAGAVVGGETYELISTTVLGLAASSVSFSSLGDYSSTYKHLQIRGLGRLTAVDTNQKMRFNGDSTSSYNNHFLYGNGSSVLSGTSGLLTAIDSYPLTASNAPANAFGAFVIDMLDAFSSTKNTTVRQLSGNNVEIQLASGLWNNTASLTSVELLANSGNYVAGSRFSLYGIRG